MQQAHSYHDAASCVDEFRAPLAVRLPTKPIEERKHPLDPTSDGAMPSIEATLRYSKLTPWRTLIRCQHMLSGTVTQVTEHHLILVVWKKLFFLPRGVVLQQPVVERRFVVGATERKNHTSSKVYPPPTQWSPTKMCMGPAAFQTDVGSRA